MIGPSDFAVSSNLPCRSARRRQRPERPRARDARHAAGSQRGRESAVPRARVCVRCAVPPHPAPASVLSTVLKNCAPATLLQWASFHSANVAHVLIRTHLPIIITPPCPDVMHATWRGGATTDRKLTQASSWAVGKTRGTEKEITGSSDQLRRAAAHTAPQLSAKLG